KIGKDNIHLTFLVIPTGAFFGYQSTPNGISISKNESVDTLRTKIWDYYFNKYRNISFNLRVVDIKRSEYVRMEPEKKNSDYFDKSSTGISIHILVEV
ncbi:6240_t:CDS:1, partial [Racocetra persica]